MERVADDPLIEIDQHHCRGIDALAVVDQHALDGLAVSGRDDLSERIVGGHQPCALNDALRVLFQQAIEHPRTGDEIVGDGLARSRHADGVDEIEAAELNDDHQQQKERENARLQAAKGNGWKRGDVHVRFALSRDASSLSLPAISGHPLHGPAWVCRVIRRLPDPPCDRRTPARFRPSGEH